jgi:hypothetical protein
MIADDAVAIPFMIVQANLRQVRHVIAITESVTQAWFAPLMLWHADRRLYEPAQQEGLPPVSEHAPEDTIAIDAAFGAVRFVREGAETFACVSVDVTILDLSSGTEADNKVQMTIKFPAAPATETVMAVIEKARAHIIARLRSAANVVEGKTADALLYGEDI